MISELLEFNEIQKVSIQAKNSLDDKNIEIDIQQFQKNNLQEEQWEQLIQCKQCKLKVRLEELNDHEFQHQLQISMLLNTNHDKSSFATKIKMVKNIQQNINLKQQEHKISHYYQEKFKKNQWGQVKQPFIVQKRVDPYSIFGEKKQVQKQQHNVQQQKQQLQKKNDNEIKKPQPLREQDNKKFIPKIKQNELRNPIFEMNIKQPIALKKEILIKREQKPQQKKGGQINKQIQTQQKQKPQNNKQKIDELLQQQREYLLQQHVNIVNVDNMTDEEIYDYFTQLDQEINKGLNDENIQKITEIEYQCQDSDEGQECSICQDSFDISQNLNVLQCDHKYHAQCIQKWLEYRKYCPLCLQEVNI